MLVRQPDGEWTIGPDPSMTVAELISRSYQGAVDKGWTVKEIPIIEQVALLHSECSEALESWRNNEPLSWTDNKGKPQGVASEYADLFIRLGHFIRKEGIDVEYEIRRKWAYNATRPYRHGDKRA